MPNIPNRYYPVRKHFFRVRCACTDSMADRTQPGWNICNLNTGKALRTSATSCSCQGPGTGRLNCDRTIEHSAISGSIRSGQVSDGAPMPRKNHADEATGRSSPASRTSRESHAVTMAGLPTNQPPHSLHALPSFGPHCRPLLLRYQRHVELCRTPDELVNQCSPEPPARDADGAVGFKIRLPPSAYRFLRQA